MQQASVKFGGASRNELDFGATCHAPRAYFAPTSPIFAL
jgi:hypothetical protein